MKRRWLILGFIGIVIATSASLLLSGPREPRYNGKRLTEWLEVIEQAPGSTRWQDAVVALRQIDAHALPWLLHELEAKDSSLQAVLRDFFRLLGRGKTFSYDASSRHRYALRGFAYLGPKAEPAFPELVARLERAENSYPAAAALTGVCGFGLADGKSKVLPESAGFSRAELVRVRSIVLDHFARATTNELWSVRCAAVVELGNFAEEASVVAPLLIERLRDNISIVRANSAWSLGRLAKEPVAVIPALIGALSDDQDGVRAQAAEALGHYYRQAVTAVPSLQKALSDPDSRVRNAARATLSKVAPESAPHQAPEPVR
jgi:HEAT repeat protein